MNFADLFRKKSIDQIRADAAAGMSDHEGTVGDGHLRRTLGRADLTLMGIAAIVGAGIFSMIGTATNKGGPAVIFLFIFTALACGFAALCYAEFASRIPVAGSAYTYSYASMGELVAWIIGWDLIVEYAIGNIAVAISWSGYFTNVLRGFGITIPAFLTTDYISAARGFDSGREAVEGVLSQGYTIEALSKLKADDLKKISESLSPGIIESYDAWINAPMLGDLRIIADFPALLITFLITCLVYIGIRESKIVGNVMTVLKLAVILLVIVLGAFYVRPENWSPFAPNGFAGVMTGVSAVFFAYIGFDALATTAEEAKDPYRDLPRAMIYSLVICTILYVLLALVLTGMVSYQKLGVEDPLAFVFGKEGANLAWVEGVIAISAVIAMATVFLVFQLGQPRLWMAMSRDGLLPRIFSSIHPKFKTPWFATIVTGFVVAIPALFMNLTEVTDLASIGTLFAFVVVCAGVLFKDKEFGRENRFIPYINSQWIVPIGFVLTWLGLAYLNQAYMGKSWEYLPETSPLYTFYSLNPAKGESDFGAFSHKIPLIFFIILTYVLAVLSLWKRLSLIPVLGVICCTYLMTEIGVTNWLRFGIWLLIGLVIYFIYGYKHSNLRREENQRNLERGV